MPSPTRLFSVIVEPKEGERGLTQRKVGMYQCPKCNTKFPTVVSKQHYLVVADDQLTKIQTDLRNLKKNNEALERKIQTMDREYDELYRTLEQNKRDVEVHTIEAKVEALEKHVAYLRKEKGDLEEKISKFR